MAVKLASASAPAELEAERAARSPRGRLASTLVGDPAHGAVAYPGAAPVTAISTGGNRLDTSVRAALEAQFEFDFGAVRVHADSRAASGAHRLGAAAYTIGSHVGFAAGRYEPATSRGRQLLAHELAHVVQQARTSVPVLQRAPAATQEVAASTGEAGAVEPQAAAPGPAPLPQPTRARLWREHPDVARRLSALLEQFVDLMNEATPVLESAGVLAERTEATFMGNLVIENAVKYALEVGGKELFDPEHLSALVEKARAALEALGPLLGSLAKRPDMAGRTKRFEARRERLVWLANDLAATPYMKTGAASRERVKREAAAQERIEKAIERIRAYVARSLATGRYAPEELSEFGPRLADILVHELRLSGDDIRDVFDMLSVNEPDLLNAALFGGATIRALLAMGIGGFEGYRARGEGFMSGFIRGSEESLLVDPAKRRKFGPGEKALAVVGFVGGAIQGVAVAIARNVKALIDLLNPWFWGELIDFLKNQLPEYIKSEETRFAVGSMMGLANADEERRLQAAPPLEYGRTIGDIFGQALVEVVLMFAGIGWLLKEITFAPRLMKVLAPIMKVVERIARTAAASRLVTFVRAVTEAINTLIRRVRILLNKIPAITRAGKAARALTAAELEMGEAAAEVRRLEQAARRAVALGDLESAQRHVGDLEKATKKLADAAHAFESQGAGIYDPVAAARAATPPPSTLAPGAAALDPAKARRIAQVEEQLQALRKTIDRQHELWFTPRGEAVRCSDNCQLLRLTYAEVLEKNPALARRLTGIEGKARYAAEEGNARLAREAREQIADLEFELHTLEQERLAGHVEKRPGEEFRLGPGEPLVYVEPRTRGAAIELDHLDTLSFDENVQKLPDWFKAIDGVKGPKRIVVRDGRAFIEFRQATGISIKSTEITERLKLISKLENDLAQLRAFESWTTGNVRVSSLAHRRLDLVFEQGAFARFDSGTEAALKEFAATARKQGVDFKWFIYGADGRKYEGSQFLKLMRSLR